MNTFSPLCAPTRISRALAASLSALVLVTATACGTTAGKQAVETATETAADIVLPVAEEQKLGEQMAVEVDKQLKMHTDPEVNAYVDRVGKRIVDAADNVPEGISFEFHVVDDDETVNAFAIPGGHIYVYSGLLKAVDNEAELASVLAHEVAHVTRRHIAQRMVAMYGYQTLASLALGENPGMVGQLAASVAAQGLLLKHSRDHEYHADVNGLRYLIAAGYDPHAMASFFEKLQGESDVPAFAEFLMSHPMSSSRVEQVRLLLQNRRDLPTETGEERHEVLETSF